MRCALPKPTHHAVCVCQCHSSALSAHHTAHADQLNYGHATLGWGVQQVATHHALSNHVGCCVCRSVLCLVLGSIYRARGGSALQAAVPDAGTTVVLSCHSCGCCIMASAQQPLWYPVMHSFMVTANLPVHVLRSNPPEPVTNDCCAMLCHAMLVFLSTLQLKLWWLWPVDLWV